MFQFIDSNSIILFLLLGILCGISICFTTLSIMGEEVKEEIEYINVKVNADNDIPEDWNYTIIAHSAYNYVSDIDTIRMLNEDNEIRIPLEDFNSAYENWYDVCIYLNNDEDKKDDNCVTYSTDDILLEEQKEIKLEQ